MATGARARLLTALAVVAGASFVAMTPASAAASPTIASQASTPTNVSFEIFDTAHLVGGSAPTGTLTFNLFGPADATCTGTPLFVSTLPVSGGTTVESAHFTTTQAGTYRWEVSYSGDANNNSIGPTRMHRPQRVGRRGPLRHRQPLDGGVTRRGGGRREPPRHRVLDRVPSDGLHHVPPLGTVGHILRGATSVHGDRTRQRQRELSVRGFHADRRRRVPLAGQLQR